MAAAFKSSKSELVAIYRLEFYKKQQNWKFSSTERRKEEERRKNAKNAKCKLNQTYNIEPAPERDKKRDGKKSPKTSHMPDEVKVEKEPEDQREEAEPLPTEERTDNLNEAFVDTETDENITTPYNPPTTPYSPKWSIQQWAAQCQPVWNLEQTDPVSSNPTQPYITDESLGTGPVSCDYNAGMHYKTEDVPQYGMGLPQHGDGANLLNVATLRDWERLGSYEGCETGWPAHTQVWTNRREGWFQEISDIPEEAIEAAEADAVDGAARALLGRADDWLRSTSSLDKGVAARCDSPASVSSGSFLCGAALAPHSTELDLLRAHQTELDLLLPHQTELDLLRPRAGALAPAALAAAVAQHAAALKELLGEARRRDVQVSPAPVEQLFGSEDYPTRDVGPAPHTHTHTHMYDPPPSMYSHTPTPSSAYTHSPTPLSAYTHSSTPSFAYTHSPSPSFAYTHNPTTINDGFVAGSFRSRPDLRGHTDGGAGRGRGRKVRVIGIDMGRPYRL